MQNSGISNAFTLDVEDYYHVSAFERAIKREQWGSLPSRVERNTEVILELLDQKGVSGTFFVLGWVAERFPALIRKIIEAGHEVASHGYSHQLVFNQTPEDFRQETERSKKILEDIGGKAVIGYRAASYSITKKSLWALDILVDLGFSYDSSVFPVKHDRYGIYSAPRFPHKLVLRSGKEIIEFPLTTFKKMGVNLPVAGGGYFRLFPYWLTRYGLGNVNKAEGMPFVFYLHPWEIDTAQPRINASLISRFRHYQNLATCKSKLEKLLTQFEFATMQNVLSAHTGEIPAISIEKYEE